ncbi:hypothetical protein Y032_0033g2764 [Ancylostoma ceylanicum]|uniref:CBF1-interacting co-repressor CIR N-terminal domain-containing protein n=1 Tax=Ancylostoma ceylanicum TaxID=53326 RepID=A0A016UQ80_9BILA|nr:hypothetical protein Y032_0033g2764 [Ancylostoma ceylanicum]
MNILPKKKWHVRTKENIARVRRDEAKAAEEEQRRLDRAITAENERRLEALRAQAAKRDADLEPFALRASSETMLSTSTGHVNLFQDLEQAERQNFGRGNKEYEEEKRKEQAEYDSKLGIQKAFAEGTKELNKEQEWYARIVRPIAKDENKAKPSVPTAPISSTSAPFASKSEELSEKHSKRKRKHHRKSSSSESEDSSDSDRRRKKKRKKEKKKKKKHHRHHSSDESDKNELEMEIEKRNRLAQLREERIIRERAERHRTQQLLNPTKTAAAAPKQKYNSMFNPELSRK